MRFLVWAPILLLVLGACDASGQVDPLAEPQRAGVPTAEPSLPPCAPPQQLSMPGWVPDKLPLLKGTYAYRHLRDREGRKRVMLYVPDTTTQKFGRFVTREWANAGYALGPGDAEQTEIELFFTDLPAQGFAKANDVACDPGYVILYLTYAPRGFSAANRPHFRRSPSPSP